MYIYNCFIVFYNIWLNYIWSQEKQEYGLMLNMKINSI